jgi:hypothetical protein
MAFAPTTTFFDIGDGSIRGCFEEKDYGRFFEYSQNDELVLAPPAHGGKNMEFPHKVWVGDGSYRHARVGKTVVHIITDETDIGWVVEKWYIKNHRSYVK